MLDLQSWINSSLIITVIAICALSGTLVRTFWLLRKGKIQKNDMYLNVISAFSTVFFVFLLKYFFFSKEVWAYEVYAGVSFVVGILSTIFLDILTNPIFLVGIFTQAVKKKLDRFIEMSDVKEEKREEIEMIREILKEEAENKKD